MKKAEQWIKVEKIDGVKQVYEGKYLLMNENT